MNLQFLMPGAQRMEKKKKKSTSKIIFFIHSILAENIPIIQILYKFQITIYYKIKKYKLQYLINISNKLIRK